MAALEKVDKIWMNGTLVEWDKAQVHVLTHALHYGTGVLEGIRAYKTAKGAAVFRLEEHMARLHRSAKIYAMDVPYSVQELMDATKEIVRVNGLESCYIRPLAYRGYGEMGLYPMNVPVDVVIAAWPWGTYLGEDGIKNGVRVKVSSFKRNDSNMIPPASKASGGYLNSILAKVEVLSSGYNEAILLNNQGFIADGPGENVFVVRNGVVFTPPVSAGALEGITRDAVMTIVRDLGHEVREENLVRTDLYLADEIFFTGTAAEIVPIKEVDDRKIGEPGSITKAVQETFFSTVHGENDRYSHWLELV